MSKERQNELFIEDDRVKELSIQCINLYEYLRVYPLLQTWKQMRIYAQCGQRLFQGCLFCEVNMASLPRTALKYVHTSYFDAIRFRSPHSRNCDSLLRVHTEVGEAEDSH
jgi:hypothetical protein